MRPADRASASWPSRPPAPVGEGVAPLSLQVPANSLFIPSAHRAPWHSRLSLIAALRARAAPRGTLLGPAVLLHCWGRPGPAGAAVVRIKVPRHRMQVTNLVIGEAQSPGLPASLRPVQSQDRASGPVARLRASSHSPGPKPARRSRSSTSWSQHHESMPPQELRAQPLLMLSSAAPKGGQPVMHVRRLCHRCVMTLGELVIPLLHLLRFSAQALPLCGLHAGNCGQLRRDSRRTRVLAAKAAPRRPAKPGARRASAGASATLSRRRRPRP